MPHTERQPHRPRRAFRPGQKNNSKRRHGSRQTYRCACGQRGTHSSRSGPSGCGRSDARIAHTECATWTCAYQNCSCPWSSWPQWSEGNQHPKEGSRSTGKGGGDGSTRAASTTTTRGVFVATPVTCTAADGTLGDREDRGRKSCLLKITPDTIVGHGHTVEKCGWAGFNW